MIYQPHPYQDAAAKHIIENDSVQLCGGSGLFLEMGLGKTVSTLTAINELMFDRFEVGKVLVIAPKRVAEHTWTEEVKKWDHLKHLKVSVCVGSEQKRRNALREKADIYTINRENVAWLVASLKGHWPFDMVVVDELSSFKSAQSSRFKALRGVRPLMNRVVGLTGTPAPNNLIDLWSQLYLLDRGERLGKNITGYRETYFSEGAKNGHIVYDYKLRSGSEQAIYDKIGDICISMKAKDWLDLPERIDTYKKVFLGDELQTKYAEFERDAVMNLNEAELTAVNAAALTNKLLQFANGAVYSEGKQYQEIHDFKIEALEEALEAANGSPVLCFYNFRHDVGRIMEKLKKYKPHELGKSSDIDKWNRGEIPFLLAHPASAGHGLNMQKGGHHIVWFGLPWSLELFQQAIARLDRQGQLFAVINMILYCPGTIEEKVIKALSNKALGQEQLMQAVKAIIAKYRQSS